ncbi:tannase/feruloyl esterase family alpha/beta hydrolase [Citricoccus sp.]|uniref:tannase/feruloyl esterase family alpha/beta hydrolase n=1 Tax=Citricoccus sp. TaxID=1978372 RepID=UPI0028BEB20E|nr:tannase/feruloyl esterase family alpha/beta hydrolase [Citricoccus sp.]
MTSAPGVPAITDIAFVSGANDLNQWIDTREIPRAEVPSERISADALNAAVSHLQGTSVISAQLNSEGFIDSPEGRADRLPDVIDVRVQIRGDRRTTNLTLWAPLRWNGRLLAVGGGGNRTSPLWVKEPAMTAPTLADGVRNGFVTASTDGGNQDSRFFAWGLDEATGDIDWELTNNWAYGATHQLAVISKLLTEAIYGAAPVYSYMMGASGGGRQTLATAQKHPEDFDGYWAECPAINWSKMSIAQLWPAIVMKDLKNPVPSARFAAMREAAIAALDTEDGVEDGLLWRSDFPVWDPSPAIGTETEAGPVTELDVEVMRLIWDGPRTSDGQQLWYGLPVGAESWNEYMPVGMLNCHEVDSVLEPDPFFLTKDWASSWIMRDPSFDWRTVTMENFGEMFHRSVQMFADYDFSDSDLTGVRDAGGKVLISHGMGDEVIPPQGTVEYHERVVETMGGRTATAEFFRVFLLPGHGHSSLKGYGPGLSLADGMTALMHWVESDTAPGAILATHVRDSDDLVDLRRPVLPYPAVANYTSGDPSVPSSWNSEGTRP